jgi:hypothetical protein
MTMAYQTQPGTLPHKVVEYLRAHPGEEFATAVLCDEFQTDATSFAKSMENPKKHGLVKSRRKPQHGLSFWWSLGDGQAAPLPHDYEPDEPMPRRQAPITPRPGPLFPTAAGAEFDPSYWVPRFTPGEVKPAAQVQPSFRAALWTDDSLIVIGAEVRPDGSVVLAPAQTAQIRRLVGAPA